MESITHTIIASFRHKVMPNYTIKLLLDKAMADIKIYSVETSNISTE